MTSLLDQVQHDMDAGLYARITFSLWALRRLSGEPRYAVTVAYLGASVKGDSFIEAYRARVPGLPMPPDDEIEKIVSELGYRHLTVGISGIAPIDPKCRFFANGRLNFEDAPLKMGRGSTTREAVRSMMA